MIAFNAAGYTVKATSVTSTAGVNGLGSSPVAFASTNYAVYGFRLIASGIPLGSGTITSITIGQNGTTTSYNNTYFTTAYLYSSASSTFTLGSATLLSTQASGASTSITFSGLSLAMSNLTTSAYLFVVLSDNLGNTSASTFSLYVSGFTYSATIGTTPALSNTGTYYGPSYTFGNITLGAATSTGLAASLAGSQTQTGILGFSVSSIGTAATISQVSLSAAISPSATIGSFFSGVTIYENATNSLTGATQLTGAVVGSLSGTTFTISGLSQALAAGGTDYFFIKANYTPPGSGSYTFQLSTNSVALSSPSATVTGGGPINGTSYILMPAPALSYTSTNYYTVGSAASLTPTSTGGAVSALSYGAGTSLTATGLNQPQGMGFDAAGNLYVADYGAGTIMKYNGVAGAPTTFISGLTDPTDIAFDASGNAYVSTAGGYIYKFNSSGGSQTTLVTGTTPPPSPGLAYAYDLVVDASNNVFYVDNMGFAVFEYVASTATTTRLIYQHGLDPNANYIYGPQGVSVDAAGNIYAMATWFGSIAEYTSAGVFSAPLVTGIPSSSGSNYDGYYMDGGGNFYVADGTTGFAYVYNSAGTAVASISGLTDTRGTVTDSHGNLFISDFTNNTITEYPINSGYTVNFAAGTTTLPPGIKFNSSTGTFSGTPVSAFSGSYTVTAINGGGSYSCGSFTINCGYPPAISYLSPGTYAENAAASLSPSNSGNAATGWSVSPALPAGLSINSSSGLISGTTSSSVTSGPTVYTVTATNQYGSGTCNVLITVYGAPVINYPQSSYSLTVNVPVSPSIAVANTGGSIIAQSYGSMTTVLGPSSTPPPTDPVGLTTDAGGNIWLTNDDYIRKFSPSGTETDYSWGIVYPEGIVTDALGNVFVLDRQGKIYKYTAATGTVATFAAEASNSSQLCVGLALDPTGNYLYFTDTGDRAIFRCPISTGISASFIQTHSIGANFPQGLQVDAAGDIYLVDQSSGNLLEYNAAGVFLQTLITGLSNPSALYIDKYGYIYIGGNGPLGKYSFNGTSVYSFVFGSSAAGLTVDASGNLYVSDNASFRLDKFSPINYVLSGGSLPAGISFDPATGTFSGTPTVAFSAITFTITAYGMGSTSSSTTVTLSCSYSYDWVGTTSSDWNVTSNWKSLTVPGSGLTAYISVNYPFTNQPTVGLSGGSTVNVGAIQIGNSGGQAATLTVNSGYTLAVTGNITKQSDANSLQSYAGSSSLAGAGTVTAANVVVNGSTALAAAYTETFSSSAGSLKLSGTVKLSSGFSTHAQNTTFNVTGGVTSATTALSTSNSVGATSSFGVSSGTLQLAAASPLSGLSAAGTNVVSFNNAGATIEYSGAAQTFYTDAAVANLSTTINYQSIKFSGTGIKSPASGGGNLNIAGNFTNVMANDAADYPLLTGTPMYFNGAGAQNIYAGSGNGSVFSNITFNGAGATTIQSGMAYVNSAGMLTMSGTATLNANGNLTLMSDASGCAAIAPITSGTPISGTVNVQRYVSAKRGYRLLSSPVYAGTVSGNKVYSINYLIGSLYLTGSGGTGGLFNAAGNPTLYLFDEGFVPQYSSFYNSNFLGIKTLSSGGGTSPSYSFDTNTAGISSGNILVANGYYCFYRGSLITETTAQLTNPNFAGVMPATLTASGNLNQGQIVFKDWYTPASNYLGAASQHFNLVGNPYPCAIDLSTIQSSSTTTGIYATAYNGVSNTGIINFIYELNPSTNNYGVYTVNGGATYPPTNGASQYIGSGQGFLVVSYGVNSSQLIFNESAKATSTHANAEGLMTTRLPSVAGTNKPAPYPLLKLTMSLDSINNEEILLAFNPDAKKSYVINEDAPHKKGAGLIGFSSISGDSVLMSINAMPLQQSQAIPLAVYAASDGLYTLSLSQLNALPLLYDIWLKDAYRKDSLDTKHNPVYSFDVSNADVNSYGTGRFTLVIRQNPTLMVHLLSFAAHNSPTGNNVLWSTENEANYTHFAVQRSTDNGKTFITLDSLVSSFLGGYHYLDAQPLPGANSYRLQMTDLNGDVSYSTVVTIMYKNTGSTITLNHVMLYPNPTKAQINLKINVAESNGTAQTPNYRIQVVNNLGVIVKTVSSADATWQSDVSTLTPGVYFISVTDGNTNSLIGKSSFVKL